MKEAIIIVTAVIAMFTIIFGLAIWYDRTNATDEASLIKEFEYNETSYYMYLDDTTDYEGNLKLTFRKGLSRNYITSISMEPTGTSTEAIQFFKDKLDKELTKDSIIYQWKENQIKIIQQLKIN